MTPLPQPRPYRLVIADDHAVVRAGIAALLEGAGGLRVVAQASTGVEAVERWKEHRPDLTLIDLKMPKMGGLEVIARIRAEQADASVVILTMFDGDEGIFRAVKAGARGYLLKDASPEELLVCVRSVCEGRSYFPTGIAARLANRISSNTLTDREQEVLIRVSKLDATSRTEAVAIARRRGLIETD